MRSLFVLFLLVFFLGCVSSQKSGVVGGADSIDECISVSDMIKREECISKVAKENAVEGRLLSEGYCGKITTLILRDGCYYDIVQENLVLYYSNKEGRNKEAFKPLKEGLERMCKNIGSKSLRNTCLNRISRAHLFRYLRYNSSINPAE